MTEIEQQLSRWQYLSEEAKAGRLYLDSEVVTRCRDACNRQIDLFQAVRRNLEYVERVAGLGDFDCSHALASMLGAKARGGERDFDTALQEHIAVLELIRDTIEVSVNRQLDQEAASTAGIETTRT